MPEATAPIDVVMPLHNGARFVERAIASVLGQSLPPACLFVVDDGSTDQGPGRVRSLIERHQGPTRITLAQQPNAGPNAARNHGLRLGRSPFVAFIDADDRWHPEKLEAQMGLFAAADSALLLVYCQGHWIDAEDRPAQGPPLREPSPLRGNAFAQLLPRNRITGSASAVLIRREAFSLAGPFDESLRTMEDFDMWLRIAAKGRIDLVERDLVGIRAHEANNTRNAPHMLRGMLRFTAKWFEQGRGHAEALHEWGHLIALLAMRCADRDAAYKLVDEHLSAEQQRLLFGKAFGSLRLYVLLKRLRRSLSPARTNS